MYFQHSDVSKVVFEGFSDDDEKNDVCQYPEGNGDVGD